MQKTITTRFIECFKHLLDTREVRSAREFALRIECHPQSFHQILKGRRDVTVQMLEKGIREYDLSYDYLFKGKGLPGKYKENPDTQSKENELVEIQINRIDKLEKILVRQSDMISSLKNSMDILVNRNRPYRS